MRQLRYAVFLLGFVVMFALAGCAGNTQDLTALTPESEAGAGVTTGEPTVVEGGEVIPEAGTEMGPAEPTAAGEAAVVEPTAAGEAAVVEPTAAGEAAAADPTVVPESIATEPAATAATQPTTAATVAQPTTAPTTAVAAATAAPTQAAATSAPTTAPAAVGTASTQSQIVTISADGSLSPSSISLDPGARLSLTLVNLSSNTAVMLVNLGNASSSITVPAAARAEGSASVSLSPQEVFVQFNDVGTYELSCSQGCTGSISVEVGGGTPAEAATPTE